MEEFHPETLPVSLIKAKGEGDVSPPTGGV
jgi:hypothetical protein